MANTRLSDEPVYWGLFGFGGMVIGFALPALLICLIIAGCTDGHKAFHFVELISHWWGAGAVGVIIVGTLWHCLHRIYHGLHDLTIHTTKLHHYALYGAAAFFSSAAVALLLTFWIRCCLAS